jgi:hypothetical protein
VIGDAGPERMSVVHVEVQRLPDSTNASGQLQYRRQRGFHRSLDVRHVVVDNQQVLMTYVEAGLQA